MDQHREGGYQERYCDIEERYWIRYWRKIKKDKRKILWHWRIGSYIKTIVRIISLHPTTTYYSNQEIKSNVSPLANRNKKFSVYSMNYKIQNE